jgi:hypothetical protein
VSFAEESRQPDGQQSAHFLRRKHCAAQQGWQLCIPKITDCANSNYGNDLAKDDKQLFLYNDDLLC